MQGLIGVPSLIVGFIFTTIGTTNNWFSGVHEAGVILIIVSAAVIAFGLLLFLIFLVGAATAVKPTYKSRRRRY